MVSRRKLRANRQNAQKSTGPKTAAGKSKARYNALRHGLQAANGPDALEQEQLTGLSAIISGQKAPLIEHELAIIIAECQITLNRIKRARVVAIERRRLIPYAQLYCELLWAQRYHVRIGATYDARRTFASQLKPANEIENEDKRQLAQRKSKSPFADGHHEPTSAYLLSPQDRPPSESECFIAALPELLALERYDTRTRSRRRRAMEALNDIRAGRITLQG